MYCPNCGKEMGNDNICYNCNNNQMNHNNDSGSAWWGVLGFFVPLAGLILYCVWHNEKPKNAKSAGIGALIKVCMRLFFFIIILTLMFMGLFTFGMFESAFTNENTSNTTQTNNCSTLCPSGGEYNISDDYCYCYNGTKIKNNNSY
jgi:heme/copper-type cytochrome/quinol oxidase subunit 2